MEHLTVQTIAQSASVLYQETVWPTAKDEEWRRSDPAGIPFDLLEETINTDECIRCHDELVEQLQKHPEYGTFTFAPWNAPVHMPSLSMIEYGMLHALDRVDTWRISHINAMGGGVIAVPKGVVLSEPILLSIKGINTDTVYAPTIVLMVEDGATACLGLEVSGDGFFAPGVHIHVGEHASCNYNQTQYTSLDATVVSSVFVKSEQASQFRSTSGQLGGLTAVDRVYASAEGTESHINLYGYYFATQDQLIDMRTYQDHVAEDTNSRALYHGAASDEAHSVYRGLIKVNHKAVETDAYLTNKNILLSDEARMDSIPCLNINTNEVRCSHGSTTGTLDPNHVFYLKTRGLNDKEAKHLLIEGFFQAVFDDIFPYSNEIANAIILERIESTDI